MDVTLIPPSSFLSAHSHHIYHGRQPRPQPAATLHPVREQHSSRYSTPGTSLPSSAGPGPTTSSMYSQRQASSFSGYSYRSKRQPWECLPPADGSSPIAKLPDEMWLAIVGHLPPEDRLSLRFIDRKLSDLALAPCLHRSLTLTSLPPCPLPQQLVKRILPHVQHLHLHLFPYPSTLSHQPHPAATLLALLDAIPPGHLRSLSLPFSAPFLPTPEVGRALQKIGGRLEKLDLRGSGLVGGRWTEWMSDIGRDGRGLKELDMGFTGITSLPAIDSESGIFRSITRLSLASCTSLSAQTLKVFLHNLPPTLETLDLSRLDQISLEALMEMRVLDGDEPTALREIKLVGIDHLTRQNIRALKRHWEDQRRACSPDSWRILEPSPLLLRKVWGEPCETPPNPKRNAFEAGGIFATPFTTTPGSSSSTPDSVAPVTPRTPLSLRRPITAPTPKSTWTPSNATGADKLPSHPFLPSPSESSMKGKYSNGHGLLGAPIDLEPPRPRQTEVSTKGKYSSGHGLLGAPIDLEPPRPRQTERGDSSATTDKRDPVSINIVHSAILESEDEAGYRQFIGTVANGTVVQPGIGTRLSVGVLGGVGWAAGAGSPGWTMGMGGFGGGLGLGLDLDAGDDIVNGNEHQDHMEEVDGGGLM